jgi:hypothetical protein
MTKVSLKTLAVALGILTLAGLAAAQSTDPKPFVGAWKGTLNVAGVDLEIGLNFSLDEAKKVQGTFDSITQGALGLVLGNIEIKDKTITFIINDVPGEPSFKGTLDATGKKLAGDFTQGGAAGTFAVTKQ